MARLGVALFLVMAMAHFACPCRATNAIYDALIERGLKLSPKETIRLPPPVLNDGFDAAKQRQAIEALVAGKYDWETFARKAVVSPFLLKIKDDERESGRIGRQVDLYFVAYGSLNALGSENYLQQQLNLTASGEGSEDTHVRVLSGEEIRRRGLPESRQPEDARWVSVESTLLGKVRIGMTTQSVKTETNESIVIASIADPRFEKDAEHPNCWRSISTDDAGHRQIGPPQPYSGMGSYVKATRLAQPAGALFMEYHVAFAEPPGWFHGANLLRSKLPIVAQDMVRKFRRRLSAR
jgi:hypothetical protein